MKVTCFLFLFACLQEICLSQNVGIGTTAPNASAQLDISSTTKGMLAPRVSTTQRTAIVTPANGLFVFDTDSSAFAYYNGSGWVFIKGTANATNNWNLAGNTGNTATYFL